MFNEQVAQAIA